MLLYRSSSRRPTRPSRRLLLPPLPLPLVRQILHPPTARQFSSPTVSSPSPRGCPSRPAQGTAPPGPGPAAAPPHTHPPPKGRSAGARTAASRSSPAAPRPCPIGGTPETRGTRREPAGRPAGATPCGTQSPPPAPTPHARTLSAVLRARVRRPRPAGRAECGSWAGQVLVKGGVAAARQRAEWRRDSAQSGGATAVAAWGRAA